MFKISTRALCLVLAYLFAVQTLTAQERLCDPSFEDCRQQLWDLIDSETVEIDFAFWYISDPSYVTKLINKFRSGVKVRIIVDPKANPSKTSNVTFLDQLQAAGIPMRFKSTPFDSGGILHMKMMLFAGQNKAQFGTGNYSSASFVASQPYHNYTLNALYFTDDPAIVNSYKTHFDDLWTDTANYSNYANVSGSLIRAYTTYTIDPALIFPPGTTGSDYDAFAIRSINAFNQETQKIDAAVYRVDDRRFGDAMIAAVNRNVPVRILIEPDEYRNPIKLWDAYNIDRMYAAGVQIKYRAHQGQMHQKSAIAYSQRLAIFGSSNWTENSSNAQAEEDYFTTKPWMINWFVNQFESKWNSSTEYQPFAPLPPDQPINQFPANGSTGKSTTFKLTWQGGLWAHKYDIYFGTSPTPPLMAQDVITGSPADGVIESFLLSNLAPGTTYYWRVVGKTMANQMATGPVWSFTTANLAPLPAPAIASLSSSSGTGNGGRAVTINGSNFSSGSVVMIGGALAANVSVASSSIITATTPPHSAGVVDVSVVNPDGQAAVLPGAYSYTEPSLLNAPSLTSVSPTSGAATGGSTVTISGSNFLPGVVVSFGGRPATSVVFNGSTSISVVTPANLAGPMDVLVTNYDGASAVLSGGYTYVGASNPAPTIAAVSPATGPTSGGTSVTISGSNFSPAATVKIGGILSSNTSVLSGSSITATTPAHPAGVVDVVITNLDGQSRTLTGGFIYSSPAPPTANSISPRTGSIDGGASVTITGANFRSGATVNFGGKAATNVNVISSTSITALTPAHAQGVVDVVITNTDGESGALAAAFTYTAPAPAPAPTISSVSPNSGSTLGGASVLISGTGFLNGAAVSVGDVQASDVSVISNTLIKAVTPARASGLVNIVVTNSDGQSATLAGAFSYVNPAPAISSILPGTGTTTGGTLVTITGAGFMPGAQVRFDDLPAAAVSVINGTTINASAPAHAEGRADVVVINADGQSDNLKRSFTYTAPTNQPPQVSISASSVSGMAPLSISFISNASDSDGTITAYRWDFGDANSSTESSPSHVYQSAGTFTARLTVTDNLGVSASASLVIEVAADPTELKISGAAIKGKKLFIYAENMGDGAVIILNGQEQKTKNDGDDPGHVLIAKKAGKNIARGDTVRLQVRTANGRLSKEFLFTRAVE